MLDHNNLEEFNDPANYDLEETDRSAARIKFYADLAQASNGSALEIACGTGIVALPIAARGTPITGVDLARPMLSHARWKARQQQLPINLIEADGRFLPFKTKFSFIFITGNAFQAFLRQADQELLLASVRRNLAPHGTFAFETRNPTGHDLTDQPEEELWFSYLNAQGQTVRVSGTQHFDPQTRILHWTTFRRWEDSFAPRTKITRIACRFTSPQELEELLHANGFRVSQQYGDWNESSLTSTSEAIISICKLK